MPVKLASDRGETRWLRGKHWTGGRRAPVEEELRRHAFAAAGAQGPGTRTGRDAIRFAARAGSRSAFLRTRRGDAVNPARPPGGSTANRWVLHACTQVVALVRGAPPDPVSQTEASGGHHSRSDEPLAARAQPADRRAADRAAIRSGCMEQEGAGRVVDLHHPALNHVHPQDAVDAPPDWWRARPSQRLRDQAAGEAPRAGQDERAGHTFLARTPAPLQIARAPARSASRLPWQPAGRSTIRGTLCRE